MTGPTVVRYRQRPPEVDALLLSPTAVETAVAWLRFYGRDAYLVGAVLHVLPTRAGAPGFDVPFGHHLIREVARGGWAPVPPGHLAREYTAVPDQQPRPAPAGPAPPRHGSDRPALPPGQPRGGL